MLKSLPTLYLRPPVLDFLPTLNSFAKPGHSDTSDIDASGYNTTYYQF
jgi:hypothetical protein